MKQEVNRNAFAKFDKDRLQSKTTSSTESDPTVRYDGKRRNLKGQCHEDFAVLGQFCAKIIALRLKS